MTPASTARSGAAAGAAAGDDERFPAPVPPTGPFRRLTAAALTFLGAGMASGSALSETPAWLRWPLIIAAAFLLPQVLMLALHVAFGRWRAARRTAFPLAMAALLVIGAQQHGWPWPASAVMAGWFLLAAWPATDRPRRSP